MGNYDIYKYKIHYFTCRVQHFQPENVRNYTNHVSVLNYTSSPIQIENVNVPITCMKGLS